MRTILVIAFLLVSGSAAADEMRIVAAGGVPFVMDDKTGLSIDVWRRVAAEADINSYDIRTVDTVEEAIRLVETGGADVAVGPISITEGRASRVTFTQPYYQAGIGVMSRPESLADTLMRVITRSLLPVLLMLYVINLVVGVLMWLLERKVNPDFPKEPFAGIWAGSWWSIVTMTTTGYGRAAPITRRGQFFASVWMFSSVGFMFLLATSVVLVITADDGFDVKSSSELRDVKTAVVRGTTGHDFADLSGARVFPERDIESAVRRLKSDERSMFVHDRPMLEYHLRKNPELDLAVSAKSFRSKGYGFATMKGSELGERINVALLRLMDTRSLDVVIGQWIDAE